MLNATHGPSASLTGLLVKVTAVSAGLALAAPVSVALVAGATAGGMLPDADHHCSSTAKVWGPATAIPCRFLSKAVGGHRAGTHDVSKGAPVLFALVFIAGLLAPWLYHATGGPHWMATVSRLTGMAVIALIAGLNFVALAAFIPGKWEGEGGSNFLISWAVAWGVTHFYPHGLPWPGVLAAGIGIVIGSLTAIAQDGCTISGIPWRGRTIHLAPRALRIRTGSARERLLIRVPVIVGVCWFTLVALGQPGPVVS